MQVNLFNNNDTTSSGFLVTSDTITIVIHDKLFTVPNNSSGGARIEQILSYLESTSKNKKKRTYKKKRIEEN